MNDIFVLVELSDETGISQVMCWSDDREKLELLALEKEWAAYGAGMELAARLVEQGVKYVSEPLRPDETISRKFVVSAIPRAD